MNGKREEAGKGLGYTSEKGAEEMEWIENMNQAMEYIEEHLTDELNIEDIAKAAGSSGYHFQRIFAVMAGMSLSEYIRRRRMTLAVADLKAGEKIIDVALKYGYSSPTAFNRAFQNVHGAAPSLVKHGGIYLKAYQPLTFKMVVTGVESLEYRIEEKGSFQVIGTSIELSGDMDEMEAPINQFWDLLKTNGTMETLKNLSGDPAGVVEVMAPDEGTDTWQYLLGAARAEAHPTFETYLVKGQTWAIFKDTAPNVEELNRHGGIGYRAIKEWLPASGYEYAHGPDIQIWQKDDETGIELEFWLPVRKKEKKDE